MGSANLIRLLNKLASLLVFVLLLSTHVLHADTVTYIITDPAGSPIAGMNQAGAVTWRENYQPFGEKLENSSSSTDNDIWFAGKEFDDETGLSFFGARNYEPTIGRFVSIDPVGFDESNIQSFGRYAYGNNNPYRFNDPDGESPFDLVFLAVDTVKLVGAIQSGVGIGAAATDLAISAASVFSPVPGVGQAVKASRIGAKVAKSGRPTVSAQKQAGHIPGTPQNSNRLKQGKPTSSFFGEKSGNRLTQQAFEKGKPVPGRPNVREHDFGVSTGTGPSGGMQSRVRVHQDLKGRIHGHPSGSERF